MGRYAMHPSMLSVALPVPASALCFINRLIYGRCCRVWVFPQPHSLPFLSQSALIAVIEAATRVASIGVGHKGDLLEGGMDDPGRGDRPTQSTTLHFGARFIVFLSGSSAAGWPASGSFLRVAGAAIFIVTVGT